MSIKLLLRAISCFVTAQSQEGRKLWTGKGCWFLKMPIRWKLSPTCLYMSFPRILTINLWVKYHHTLLKGQGNWPTGWIKILAHLGLRISVWVICMPCARSRNARALCWESTEGEILLYQEKYLAGGEWPGAGKWLRWRHKGKQWEMGGRFYKQ